MALKGFFQRCEELKHLLTRAIEVHRELPYRVEIVRAQTSEQKITFRIHAKGRRPLKLEMEEVIDTSGPEAKLDMDAVANVLEGAMKIVAEWREGKP